MSNENEEKTGTVKISDDVLAICALDSARDVAGFRSFVRKGIKINQSDEGISMDLYILVDYGFKIPEVAWNLQNKVKKDIEGAFELIINSINIHVQGVHFLEEE